VFLDYTDYAWFSDVGGHFVTDSDGRYFFCDLKFAEAIPGMFVWTSAPGFREVIQPVREPGVLGIEVIRR
jgi:hypothetical protein